MSSEDDLKRYQDDQNRFFQDLEEKQRQSAHLIAARELSEALERAGVRIEQLVTLKRQLLKLGRLAGMSETAADSWATPLIVEAIRLRLESS